MRTLLLNKSDESYLHKCAVEHKFACGVIIGHHAEPDKSIIVHLARNNEEDADMEDLTDIVLTVEDINSQALATQWLSASRMCPGSLDVLGIFISSVRPEMVDEKSEEFKTSKKLFADVYDLLVKNEDAFGASTTDISQTDYVLISYTTQDKKLLCKTYNYSNGGTFSSLEHRFVEKPFEWIAVETNYELDDIYPIFDTSRRINIEQQFQSIIKASRNAINASEVILYNEAVDEMMLLQTYLNKKMEFYEMNGNMLKASIILPVKCQMTKNTEIKVREFNGTVRMSGTISSRIYCNPRNTLGDVKRFLRDDIQRSMLTRIQVYCDGLTDPNVSNELLFISEPPRRVYFTLPSDDVIGSDVQDKRSSSVSSTPSNIPNKVHFSDYIFRGEATTVVVAQAKQILDVEIDEATINLDVEALPDDTSLTDSKNSSIDKDITDSVHSSMPHREITRTMYMLGILVALLVLFVSIALNYAFGSKSPEA